MLRKPITYTDYNGVEQTEDFYFNLTKAELVELEMGHEGGLGEGLKKIAASNDGNAIMQEFKKILLASYGQRSPDGKRFIKNQQLRDEFESTEAYSVLFMSVVTDPEAAAEFVSGIMPQDLMKQAQLTMQAEEAKVEFAQQNPDGTVDEEYVPFQPPADPKIISYEEFEAMDAAQRQAGLNAGVIKVELQTNDIVGMGQKEFYEGMNAGHFVIAEE